MQSPGKPVLDISVNHQFRDMFLKIRLERIPHFPDTEFILIHFEGYENRQASPNPTIPGTLRLPPAES